MKFIVIVLCLLSEKYLIHALSLHRFNWFKDYSTQVMKQTDKFAFMSSPWLKLLGLVLPLFLVTWLVLCLFGGFLFGFVGLVLNLLIFYYCLGPKNPFYPSTEKKGKMQADASDYFSEVNGQLFAVIFWYIFTGPLGILVYRLVSLSQALKPIGFQARLLTDLLDWLPARLTALLYMLVGNFQRGLVHLVSRFLSAPAKNNKLLEDCGLASAASQEGGEVPMAVAEQLVEHAVIVLLVFLALFTLVAWM